MVVGSLTQVLGLERQGCLGIFLGNTFRRVDMGMALWEAWLHWSLTTLSETIFCSESETGSPCSAPVPFVIPEPIILL